MEQIDDTAILTKIYIVAKTHLEILQKEAGQSMTEHYKTKLIEMLDRLSERALKRLYQLAEYLYIHKEKGGEE